MILSTTMVYPNPARPTQGIFVERRLRALAEHTPVRVVAPVPWFPVIRPREFQQSRDESRRPAVEWPSMFYLPGLAKTVDATFYARALLAALRRSDTNNLRAIDAHFVWPDGVGAWRVARKLGLPFVCTIRGKLVSQSRYAARRRRIAAMLRDADALIAVSDSLATLAREVAGKPLDVRVIPNGIDASIFHRTAQAPDGPDLPSRAALGWSPHARYAVCVGHLQSLKGFDTLVAAWPQVRRRAGDVRLVLIGGPAGEPHFERKLRAAIDHENRDFMHALPDGQPHDFETSQSRAVLGPDTARSRATLTRGEHAPDNHPPISLAGRVEPDQIARMLNAADLFVLASRSEGWCNAIVEALACGCPVVATDVGGNREIVTGPRLGTLVPPENPAAFARAVVAALDQPWNRADIARAGAARDWSTVGRQCAELFRDVGAI